MDNFDMDALIEEANANIITPTQTTQEAAVIAENPEKEKSDIDLRFRGMDWSKFINKTHITVIGLGGIGSHLSFLLSRLMPCSMTLYDDDVVELKNLGGQLYSKDCLHVSKANSIQNIIRDFSLYHASIANNKFEETSHLTNYTFCCVDNMATRKLVFEQWEKYNNTEIPGLFIDGRLSVDTLQIFTIPSNSSYYIDKYKKEYLFEDKEADTTICNMKQTTFMGNMIASVMTNLFVNYCRNIVNKLDIADLPFFTEFTSDSINFKTIN